MQWELGIVSILCPGWTSGGKRAGLGNPSSSLELRTEHKGLNHYGLGEKSGPDGLCPGRRDLSIEMSQAGLLKAGSSALQGVCTDLGQV